MVIAANAIAARLTRFSPWLFLPLFLTLAVLIFIPREIVAGFPLGGRLTWSVLVVPLPLLFAGLVFSTTFREAPVPSAAFGANLIGAMVGGFAEYLTMAIGNHRLSMLVVVVYLLSLLTTVGHGRRVPAT